MVTEPPGPGPVCELGDCAAAFCAAAALPHLHPELRRKLLQSISEAAATASGWSNRQPVFYPQWVEKVDAAVLPH